MLEELGHRLVAIGCRGQRTVLAQRPLLEEAGSKLEHICKVTTYITDRAHREAVYNVVGRHLKGIHPCGTGIIVRGLAMPEMMMEIDVEAMIPEDEHHPGKP